MEIILKSSLRTGENKNKNNEKLFSLQAEH